MPTKKSTLRDNPLSRNRHLHPQTPEVLDVQNPEPQDAGDPDPRWRKRKGIKLEQVTVYLEPTDVVALSRYQDDHYLKEGKRIEKSEVVRQALRKYLE